MFTIFVDGLRRRVRVRMGGMMTPDEVYEFSRQQQAKIRTAGFVSGGFDMLMETEGVVQSQETMTAFQNLIETIEIKARRVAVVRLSKVAQMQSRRIGQGRDNYKVFDNIADAEIWLSAD